MKLSIIYSERKTYTWAMEFAETYGYEVSELTHITEGDPDEPAPEPGNIVIKDENVKRASDIKNAPDPVAVTVRGSSVTVDGIKTGGDRVADYSIIDDRIRTDCICRAEYISYPYGRCVCRTEISNAVSKLLFVIGFPSHLNGYSFIKESVVSAFLHPNLINEITKGLYPYVAELMRTTAEAVEHSIRTAVQLTGDSGSIGNIGGVFGCVPEGFERKLTNGEFIALMCEAVKYELKLG